jgi:hypothetical protein
MAHTSENFSTFHAQSFPTRNLYDDIDLLMEPVIDCRPRPIMRHFQIEVSEDLGYKCMELNQRDLFSSVFSKPCGRKMIPTFFPMHVLVPAPKVSRHLSIALHSSVPTSHLSGLN